MVHRLAVDIFKGPVKPGKHSRTGLGLKLLRKAKQRRKKEESGRGGAAAVERENQGRRQQRVGFLRRENPEPQKVL